MTQREFCRVSGLRLPTLTLWLRKARLPKAAVTAPPRFAEVRLSTPAPGCAVTLHLPSGARLEIGTDSAAIWPGLGLLLRSLQG